MTIDEILRRIRYRLLGRVLHFYPKGKVRGTVLVSYITLPYFNTSERALNTHTNRWESMDMVQNFLERGYEVDLIDITNTSFVPKKKYTYFVDNYHNMERLAPLLPLDCIKIFHASTSHWKFNNTSEQKRFDDLFARREVRLTPDRPLPINLAIELCDIATLLGNDHTASTYAYAHKEIVRIPLSTTHMYPSPEYKNFEEAKNNFIWFGGAGVIHKGLDLVVEAFAEMPELMLTICGKIEGEKDFLQIYEHELALPNIKVAGFMDPGSKQFKELCEKSVALVYPSCAEGQSGGVVLTMHAGLIPIISRESGVDVGNFGIIFKENTTKEIKREVRELSNLPANTLRERSMATWRYARGHHTRETFAKAYHAFVERLESKYPTR